MPEALERWSVDMISRALPRHMQIIFEINKRFLDEVAQRYPGNERRLAELSIIQEGPVKMVRMAHLAVIGSHSGQWGGGVAFESVEGAYLSRFP